jgi:16S rRNA (adenine1518-N6/adenine1519-N6)-dimethyltransferase
MAKARKRFGQHFLERPWVDKVIRAIDPRPSDVFIEIGPGRGALTTPLAAASRRVVAFEIDRELAQALTASARSTLTVVSGDFLKTTPDVVRSAFEQAGDGQAPGTGVRAAGNLPYNVASPILFKLVSLLREGVALTDATLMLQREVAERVLASPGSKDYGVLTVLVRLAADAEFLLALPPGAFRPQPKVRSALIRLRFREDRPRVSSRKTFANLVQATFSRRRKTLSNALKAFHADPGLIQELLGRAGIDGSRRPETLDIAEFASLADLFEEARSRPPVL